jgi:hypothetical protein
MSVEVKNGMQDPVNGTRSCKGCEEEIWEG